MLPAMVILVLLTQLFGNNSIASVNDNTHMTFHLTAEQTNSQDKVFLFMVDVDLYGNVQGYLFAELSATSDIYELIIYETPQTTSRTNTFFVANLQAYDYVIFVENSKDNDFQDMLVQFKIYDYSSDYTQLNYNSSVALHFGDSSGFDYRWVIYHIDFTPEAGNTVSVPRLTFVYGKTNLGVQYSVFKYDKDYAFRFQDIFPYLDQLRSSDFDYAEDLMYNGNFPYAYYDYYSN